MSKKTVTAPALSENTKRAIIITAICLVAIIIISVALALILKPEPLKPAPEDPSQNPSSNLPVKNGDFALTSTDDARFPKTALNWTKYGFKAPEGTSHDFNAIHTTEKVVMGIIDTKQDNWSTVESDLAIENINNVTNPGVPSEDTQNDNVYMIATKEATSANILSDSVSIAATTSVKITFWLNTSQLKDGSTATIMIQKSTLNAKTENQYAYNFSVSKQDGWQSYTFYIFNRQTSTQYVRCSIGIGNIYGETEQTGEGVLFVDDISYETVTANEYREKADNSLPGDTTFKIIDKDETTSTEDPEFLTMKATDNGGVNTFKTSEEYLNDLTDKFSPFTNRDDFKKEDGSATGFEIYKLSNNGTNFNEVGLRLTNTILVQTSDTIKDHHHFSFWIRTESFNKNKLALANIFLQEKVGENEYKDIDNGSFTLQSTSQDVENDTNNGWTKFDIYIKPSTVQRELSLLFTFGNKDGYSESSRLPEGNMYVTSPAYELISYNEYNNANSGSNVKKISLTQATASPSITNGSFSTLGNTGTQPTGWTPVFAGENAIYRDGKGNDEIAGLNKETAAVQGSGVDKHSPVAPKLDDDENNVLKLVNNENTSFGYISGNITASANTMYVFSVLAKTEGNANPYFYVIDTEKDRANAVIGSVTDKTAQTVTGDKSLDELFCKTESVKEGDGWTRYYIVIVTGKEAKTVRVALFNGSITGDVLTTDTVYYDKVEMDVAATYSLVKDTENKDSKVYNVEWKAGSDGYADLVDKINEDTNKLEGVNVNISEPTEEEWTEIRAIPEDDDKDDDDDNDASDATKKNVDLALLFSILSSVILVAALAVVIVIKIFKKRNN